MGVASSETMKEYAEKSEKAVEQTTGVPAESLEGGATTAQEAQAEATPTSLPDPNPEAVAAPASPAEGGAV